jgi:hypothetical protein
MSSDTPAPLAAAEEMAEEMTVEIRDSKGIPWVQARVTAANAGEALDKASSAHPETTWLFLREMDRHELAQIIRDQAIPAQHDTASGNVP